MKMKTKKLAMALVIAGCAGGGEAVRPGTEFGEPLGGSGGSDDVPGPGGAAGAPARNDAGPGSGGRGGTAGGGGGGTGGSAGRDGGTSPDSAPLGGVDCKDAKFCDDFESYATGKPPAGYGLRQNGGTLTVESTKAFSGTKAVYMKSNAGATKLLAMISRGKPVLPLPGNVVHGRMTVFLTAVPQGGVHWDNTIFSGLIPGTTTRAQYAYGGMFGKFIVVYNPHDCNAVSQTAVPAGRWVCLQWQFDGPNMTTRLWVDGKPIPDQTVVGKTNRCVDRSASPWVAPSFDNAQFGFWNYQDSPVPIEMWMDDVAIDSNPIACPTRP